MAIDVNDVLNEILDLSGLDSVENSWSDLSSEDGEKIYKCIDGKMDNLLDFVLENCIEDSDAKLTAKDIREMKSAIQSDSLEDLLLGVAGHLDENYLDGKYEDIIKNLDAIVNIKDTYEEIKKISDDVRSSDVHTRTAALNLVANKFFDFGSSLAKKLPPIASQLVGYVFEIGGKILEKGSSIVEGYAARIDEAGALLDDVLNDIADDQTIENLEGYVKDCEKLGIYYDACGRRDELDALRQQIEDLKQKEEEAKE